MSNADYLKKYSSSGADKAKRRKKVSKPSGGLKVVDDEDELDFGKQSEMVVTDDAPTVVAGSTVGIVAAKQRGSWEEVASSRPANVTQNPTRHDSDSDSDAAVPRRPVASGGARHDSDSDSDADVPRRPNPNPNPGASTASASARKRHDSDSDSDSDVEVRRKSPNPSAPAASASRRHDSGSSDSDTEVQRRPAGASSSSSAANQTKETKEELPSARRTGLIAAEDFKAVNESEKKKKDAELAGQTKDQLGKGNETVYRDKRGRKLDMLNQFMRTQASKDGAVAKLEEAQYEWGKGAVQKGQQEEAQQELKALAGEGFARMQDDTRVEAQRKAVIRDGDPMAAFLAAQNQEEEQEEEEEEEEMGARGTYGERIGPPTKQHRKKPKYTGPAPPPNRFHIMPGFRWDANDRGNGWESKLLTLVNGRANRKDEGYAMSSASM